LLSRLAFPFTTPRWRPQCHR